MKALGLACTLALLLGVSVSALASDPPHTTITSGPSGQSVLTSPAFAFSSDEAGTFECSLDSAPFTACGSPTALHNLAFGEHTFSVRALNTDGQADPAPPVVTWTVAPSPQEATSLRLRQPRTRSLKAAAFRELSGTASSLAGISRVQVAITFGDPDKSFFPPRCWFVDLRSGELVRQTCLLPPYVTVRGTSNWHYEVPAAVRRKIPAGRYVLKVRAINSYGATFFKRFRLTVR